MACIYWPGYYTYFLAVVFVYSWAVALIVVGRGIYNTYLVAGHSTYLLGCVIPVLVGWGHNMSFLAEVSSYPLAVTLV